MRAGGRRGRNQRGVILALGVLLAWRCAFALDAALDANQYAHTAWKNRDGFARGAISSIAQTPDGYLWLGTEFGLLRFDGVRAVSWQAPKGESLPDAQIRCLLGARDGTLWIGTWKGLASWKDGRLTTYPPLAGEFINALVQDRDGVVWVTAHSQAFDRGKLCAIRSGGVQCEEDGSRFGKSLGSLLEDSKGQLWATAATGLWRLRPGSPRLQALAALPTGSLQGLAHGDSGALLVATQRGIVRVVDGTSSLLLAAQWRFGVQQILRDRDGGLWIGTLDRGLLHLHNGHTDAFGTLDGLAGDSVTALFEDREGDIWVASLDGLDRFRNFAAATYSITQGLSSVTVVSVLASRDGSIWVSTADGLNRWRNGELTVYAHRPGNSPRHVSSGVVQPPAVREIGGSGLPSSIGSLFEDDRSRIWVGSHEGVGYLENDQYVPIEGASGGLVNAITEDSAANLWIAHDDLGLLQVAPDRKVRRIPWLQLGSRISASRLTADPKHEGVWLGFRLGGVAHFVHGQIRASYSAADGLAKGQVFDLRAEADGTLWVGAEGGLSRLKNGRIATLDSTGGLPCDSVDWMIDDDAGGVWVRTACGIVRIPRSELDTWAAEVDRGGDAKRKIRTTVFDDSNGVRSTVSVSSTSPHVARSRDGRLWFATLGGVGVVDPRHLPHNALAPPVQIEQIIADRNPYDPVSGTGPTKLPPLLRDLQIDYTALSLVAPEKILFRYKLEGRDRNWQEAGNRRQAFYSDLPPGSYRFRVIASNNSGVWNEQGASLDFSIAPAYWQTGWFRALCVAVLLALLWGVYHLRVWQLKREFGLTLEARVSERTRIARDLHDTLLQSFHGLLLRFQTALVQLPPQAVQAKKTLEQAIDQAAQAITEGREAVQGLRASVVETNDLALSLRTLGEELAADGGSTATAGVHVVVEGVPRTVHPILRDEVYRIGSEAIRNALRHAAATRIEVELCYDDRQLRLRVRDDGKGIDPKYLGEQAREGHFGLHGMRERAEVIGGKLTVWSALDAGTEVELSIPADRAYAAAPRQRRS